MIAAAATAAMHDGTFGADDELDAVARDAIAALRVTRAQRAKAIVSPARAARETASLLGYEAVSDSLVRDLDFGSWSRRTLAEIATSEPEAVELWLRDPAAAPHGGESIANVVARARTWLDARAETGRLACITHPAVIRAIVLTVLDAPLAAFARLDAQALHATDLTYDGRRWALRAANVPLMP